MITIGMLDLHPSSPRAAYGNLGALAQRTDLYTGDDFYFGFASSNHTFLDIIGGHKPLAIKHGPIFSIYRHDVSDGYSCQTYYIDVKNKTLLPIIAIIAKPSAAGVFNRLLPWLFIDFYLQASMKSSVVLEVSDEHEISPEEMIRSALEQMAKNSWPDNDKLNAMGEAVATIASRENDLNITLVDLPKLSAQMKIEQMAPVVDDFVAPYNPFYDNYRVDLDFVMENNPERITVRQVNDQYPRIEVIIPGASAGNGYAAVFKKHDLALYNELQAALAQPKLISRLLVEHFPEIVSQYFTKHQFELPSEPAAGFFHGQ